MYVARVGVFSVPGSCPLEGRGPCVVDLSQHSLETKCSRVKWGSSRRSSVRRVSAVFGDPRACRSMLPRRRGACVCHWGAMSAGRLPRVPLNKSIRH